MFLGKAPKDIYKHFKSWQRLEPHSRENDFKEGVEARTADALWYLTRQWQMGEFQAEDAGSLIGVEIKYRTEKVNKLALAGQPFETLSDRSPPVETLIEAEPLSWNWRARIQAGQQFERILLEVTKRENASVSVSKQFIAYLHSDESGCGIAISDAEGVDSSTQSKIRLLSGRGINGEKLLYKIKQQQLSDPTGALDPTIIDAASDQFLSWHTSLIYQPNSDHNASWQPATLDYRFSQKTTNGHAGETELVSESYRNGDLEWYNSNLDSESEPDETLPTKTAIANPTRVVFPGMPLPRWWAMEDSSIDFARMGIGKTDLIKTLLSDFTFLFADDWYVVPLPVQIGTITHIEEVKTIDVFGKTDVITSARVDNDDPLERWDLYSLAKEDEPKHNAASDFLYVPYSSGFREESDAVEEVRFLKDEGANMIWGVEHITPNAWGKPVQVSDLQSEDNSRQGEDVLAPNLKDAKLKYQIVSPIPSNWIPFVPYRVSLSQNKIRLRQGQMFNEKGKFSQPVTRILGSPINPCDDLHEEAVTRAGVKVQITRQRLRWIDGKTYVWHGRKVLTGKGEGRSGLEFDKVVFTPNGNEG